MVALASAAALALSCVGEPPQGGERIGVAESAVINGAPDASGAYLAVGHLTSYATLNGVKTPIGWANTCSASLVARRVMITAGHCVVDLTTGCETLAQAPRVVVFAAPDGTLNDADDTSRAVAVKAVVTNPASIFTVAQCPNVVDLPPCDPHCQPPSCLCGLNQGEGVCALAQQESLPDRAVEASVLYLATDPPSDVLANPLPLILDKAWADDPESAATLRAFAGIEGWQQNCANCDPPGSNPLVSIVGYGVGSNVWDNELLNLPGRLVGRNYGVTTWESLQGPTETKVGPFACGLSLMDNPPDVVLHAKNLVPQDFVLDDNKCPDLSDVKPGANFFSGQDSPIADTSGVRESMGGNGDSGGPVLVGTGPMLNGESPTQLPAPQPGDTYDPNQHYVIGITASRATRSIQFDRS